MLYGTAAESNAVGALVDHLIRRVGNGVCRLGVAKDHAKDHAPPRFETSSQHKPYKGQRTRSEGWYRTHVKDAGHLVLKALGMRCDVKREVKKNRGEGHTKRSKGRTKSVSRASNLFRQGNGGCTWRLASHWQRCLQRLPDMHARGTASPPDCRPSSPTPSWNPRFGVYRDG